MNRYEPRIPKASALGVCQVLHNACHAEALGLHIVRKHMQGQSGKKVGYWLKKKEEEGKS